MLGTDTSLPVSSADLIRFGFRESAADEAAREIADLAEGIFGPFELVAAEGWALSAAKELGPADLRACLMEAAEAPDPLAFLTAFPDAQAALERRMAWRWSSRRARALGHPVSLRGQTWLSLSEAARDEVRESLGELAAYTDTRVLRNRPARDDLESFLSELAEIYLVHARQVGDRAARAGRLQHRTDVPHSPTSRFIRLAELILSRLMLPLPEDRRLHPSWRSARGLAERWKRWKAHVATGWDEGNNASDDGSSA